jgi:effector-binding domain-containing protein
MLLTNEIHACELTSTYTAVMRAEMPVEELPAWLMSVFPVVSEQLHRDHVRRAGPPFARYTFLGDMVAVEAGFPVAAEIPTEGPVKASRLPAGHAAVAVHFGPYEELARVHREVLAWLADHGHAPSGPHWEIYHTAPDDEPDPARWRTDVVVPYERS